MKLGLVCIFILNVFLSLSVFQRLHDGLWSKYETSKTHVDITRTTVQAERRVNIDEPLKLVEEPSRSPRTRVSRTPRQSVNLVPAGSSPPQCAVASFDPSVHERQPDYSKSSVFFAAQRLKPMIRLSDVQERARALDGKATLAEPEGRPDVMHVEDVGSHGSSARSAWVPPASPSPRVTVLPVEKRAEYDPRLTQEARDVFPGVMPRPAVFEHAAPDVATPVVLANGLKLTSSLDDAKLGAMLEWLPYALSSTDQCKTAPTVTEIVSWSGVDTAGFPHGDNEWYTLTVGAGANASITICADTVYGEMHALRTLAQLVVVVDGCATIPDAPLTIRDGPRLAYRGLLIDPPRVFLTVPEVEHTIAMLAMHKGNALHLRLTDDQHFVFNSTRRPLMIASEKESYSPDDLRRIVAYAAARGVRVIPELDVPGHAKSWGASLIGLCPKVKWSVTLNPLEDEVYRVIEDLLQEIIAIFPDPILHLGGDEVSACWDQDSAIQRRAALSGLDGKHLLEVFEKRLLEMLAKPEYNGKVFMRWEDLEWKLMNIASLYPADRFIFQPWLSGRNTHRFIDMGYGVISSKDMYFDVLAKLSSYKREAAWREIYEREFRLMKDETRYKRDLWFMPKALESSIIGAEASIWDHGYHTFDVKVWPLMSAVAERSWSVEAVDTTNTGWARKTRFDAFLREFRTAGVLADHIKDPIPYVPGRQSITHPPS